MTEAGQRTTSAAFLDHGGEMGALTRTFDWSATAVGPIERWPQSLRTIVQVIVTSRHPMFLWWGPELVQFYNDGYRPSLGERHPRALGDRGRDSWADIWPVIGPEVESVMQGGDPTWHEDHLVPIVRNGRTEEVYWTYSYSPVLDDDDQISGTLVTVQETTPRVLNERRMAMLRTLAERTADEGRTVPDVYRVAARVLGENAADVPFALLYLVSDDRRTLRLMSEVGALPGRTWPKTVDLEDDGASEGGWPLRQVERSATGTRLTDLRSRFGALPGGPWPEPAESALVSPIMRAGQRQPYGVLVAGISPRLEFDDEYRGFFDLLAGQIADAIANARAREDERRRADALAEIDRAKTVFFSNVSHEFRTPLTLLIGSLEHALAGMGDEPDTALAVDLDVASRNAGRLLRLVNTLLDFTRIEAGRAEASYEPVDLAAVTAELASVFRSAVEQAGMRLFVDCPPLPEPVYVDRDMWEKIVLNLISNAFKYTLAGEIRVSLGLDGGEVTLSVIDTGAGIPEEELPNLFTRFHRVVGAQARTGEGSGIGLAFVQELVRLHGGTVSVQSTLGAGSRFTVTLPLGAAHLPANRVVAARREAPTTALGARPFVDEALRWLPAGDGPDRTAPFVDDFPPAARRGQAAKAQVLIADDNADMRDYLHRLLSTDYDVIAVADGEQAMRAAAEHQPDLVITDVMMPNLDGFELVDALRDQDELRTIPVILLSARAGEEAHVEGMRAGANDYLIKPFSARELLARVESQLSLAAARAETVHREQAARERIEAALEQAPAALSLLAGPDHVYTLANPRYLELIDVRDVIGKPAKDVLLGVDRLGFLELLDQVYETGEPFVGSERPLRLPGAGDGADSPVYLNYVLAPTRDVSGVIDGVFIHGYEVTEQVEARLAAEDAVRVREEFLSIASHELRNPVAAVQGTAQLLRRAHASGKLTEERQATYLEALATSATHLGALTDDLLDVSRLQRGALPLRVEPTELSNLVRQIVRLGEWGDGRIVVSADQELRAIVDVNRIRQVVSNLLGNAVKYSPNGDTVRVRLQSCGAGLLLEVQDAGIGIPTSALESIFTPFGRAANAISANISGLGLGLYLSQRIAEQHGGYLWAQSEGDGQGTLMSLWLPVDGDEDRDTA